jgi:2,3-dimethylmalate lyase
MNLRKTFKDLLDRNQMCVAPGAYDALSAKMVCNAGFPAIYVTGFGVTASLLGKPDIGFLTLDEMAGHLRRMAQVVTVPIIADAEAGFGNAVNAMRTVQEYEAAGVAGLHMEDQYVPKQCRPDGLPQGVSAEEHAEKIRAAVEARSDPDFCIIGRTDALGRHGLAEAVRRANLYVEAGADMIFVHGAKDPADLQVIVREINAPNVMNYSTLREGHISPLPSFADLEKIGFKLLILPGELLCAGAKTMARVLNEMKEGGGKFFGDVFMEPDAFLTELEARKYRKLEDRFLPQGTK